MWTRYISEFKKSLRNQLKDAALMSYGKNIKELSVSQTRTALDRILKLNYNYWSLANYGTYEEYKQVFRETFPKELKYIGKQVK